MKMNTLPYLILASTLLLTVTKATFANERHGFLADGENRLEFEPVTAKFFRLDLSWDQRSGSPALDEVLLFGPDDPEKNLAADKHGTKVRTSSCISGYAIHRNEHINDGLYGNDHAWVAGPMDDKPVVVLELPEAMKLHAVVFSRDRFGDFNDRVPADVVCSISENGENFVPVNIVSATSKPARIVKPRPKGAWAGVAVPGPPPPPSLGTKENRLDPVAYDAVWKATLVDEEYAWLKAFGRADIDPGLMHTPYPIKRHPLRLPEDVTTLVRINEVPQLDGLLNELLWLQVSNATVRVAKPGTFEEGALVEYVTRTFLSGDQLYIAISTNRLLSSHLAVIQTADGGGVVAVTPDGQLVWRIYEGNNVVTETPLEGASGFDLAGQHFEFAVPLSLLPGTESGVAIRTGIGGRYTPNDGHRVVFQPSALAIVSDKCVPSLWNLRLVNHSDHPLTVEEILPQPLRLYAREKAVIGNTTKQGELGPEQSLTFFVREESVRGSLNIFYYDPVSRTLDLFKEMVDHAEDSGMFHRQIKDARKHLEGLRSVAVAIQHGTSAERELFYQARKAKREFFLSLPGMEEIETILCEKRFPLHPSHNYSDYYDSEWRAGSGIYTLNIPKEQGRFVPEKAVLTELFKTTGMCRHPMADFNVSKIYFTNRSSQSEYWHIMEMNPDGSELRKLTDGPFHDLWPCPLPDGDLAFITTRCRQRYLCWEPQASVLYRMDKNGENLKRLSFANLTEFAPSVSRDGRILWTRSEYLDKGADYGHTLWYIRPDGAVPELTFGNTVVLPQGYANGREIPGTNEVLCTMISHFGDLNGPIAILDIDQGRMNPDAMTSITPEVPWPGFWARTETFREPFPISTDLFLVSHSPRDRFGLFVIDRFGNRELLYIDDTLGSMCPTPLRPRPTPPLLSSTIDPTLVDQDLGVFTLEDVYIGIEHAVPRGAAKYLRVCREMPHFLEKRADGTYRPSYTPFMEFYASPVDLISGPYGWTSYVAKGDLGTVEIEKDGSASFLAPSGQVLFFELLDENYTEIQRMRSVVQLQPGEVRSCVGCHEDRAMTPTGKRRTVATQRAPKPLTPPPWGAGAFDYQKTVQPVFDKNCISCHNAETPNKADLTGTLDKDFIPSSFSSMIRGGYVHHFQWQWQAGIPTKAEPYTFGTVKSKIWSILDDENHKDVKLSLDEERAIKCWIDLSCPLWSDYKQRSLRNDPNAHDGTVQAP